MSNPRDFPGLDYDFMRYMGVQSDVMQQIQSHYLPYFENRRKVLDLACGDGDFVAILHELGIDVTGVDLEPKAVEKAQKLGLPVVESDVFAYLAQCEDECFDAIFCAHLVEHLPYPQVIQLVQEAYRVLEPGGLIILATPNARGLYSHLEMFYLHYDHINFYHPKLLCFFLEHENFVNAEEGVNPKTASPLMAELNHMHSLREPAMSSGHDFTNTILSYYQEERDDQAGPLRKLVRAVKNFVAYLFVRPYIDRLAKETVVALHHLQEHLKIEQHAQQQQTVHDLNQVRSALISLNEPFECYALAHKPNEDDKPTLNGI